jgi:hypothetical protein
MSTTAVITVTHTVMDGQVARWYQSVEGATYNQPVLSASRNGVSVHAEYLTSIPEDWVAAAKAAYLELAEGPHADVRRLATHRNRGFMNGPIEPVPAKED